MHGLKDDSQAPAVWVDDVGFLHTKAQGCETLPPVKFISAGAVASAAEGGRGKCRWEFEDGPGSVFNGRILISY